MSQYKEGEIYEVIFRETVAHHFFVKAPNREAASLWADKHGADAVNAQIELGEGEIEEQGVEELFVQRIVTTPDFEVDSKGDVKEKSGGK